MTLTFFKWDISLNVEFKVSEKNTYDKENLTSLKNKKLLISFIKKGKEQFSKGRIGNDLMFHYKILCIKMLREKTECGLKEGKDAVEGMFGLNMERLIEKI